MSLTETIIQVVSRKEHKKIRELFNQHYPIDLALALNEVDETTLKEFILSISNSRLASIIEVAQPQLQSRMLEKIPFRRVGLLFQQMSNDDIVDILGNLPVGIRKKYLNMMKGDSQTAIRAMLSYPQDSAGGIMTTEFISLREELTVEEALTKLRELTPNSEMIHTLFVNGINSRLIGWFDIRDLFTRDLDDSIHDVMNQNVLSVTPEMDQESVAQLAIKYDLSVVPVVNNKGVLLGIITVDDILHVVQSEHHEDLIQFNGLLHEEGDQTSFKEAWMNRLPWLGLNSFLSLLPVLLLHGLGLLEKNQLGTSLMVSLLFFAIPNLTSQALAIGLQASQRNQDKFLDQLLRREISLALVNGLLMSLVVGFLLSVLVNQWKLALVTGLFLVTSMVLCSLIALYLPSWMKNRQAKSYSLLRMSHLASSYLIGLGLLLLYGSLLTSLLA